jgi:hypothetical protein
MEASWLLARREVFSAPFRIRRKPELNKSGKPIVLGLIPVPGEASPAQLEFGPGLFTQQMAVPWQADFRECEAGFVSDPDIPGKRQMRRIAWWPANRPDDVFPQDTPKSRKSWARLLAKEGDPASERPFWDADDNDLDAHFRDMVELWSTLGFVVEMKPDGTLLRDLFEIDANPSFPSHRGEKLFAALQVVQTRKSMSLGRHRMRDYDLAIAGAGPAGSVTALLAVRSGLRVCLIEKNGYEKHRFGETAPPELRPELTRLGLDHLTKPPSAEILQPSPPCGEAMQG